MSASCSVAVGSAAALICDTGASLDYLVESAPDHRLFRNAIDDARTRYVPGLVLAELDYFLRDERRAMELFMRDLAGGAFTYARPRSPSSRGRWRSTGATRISALASWMDRSLRSRKDSASVASQRVTCVTLR